MSIEYAHSDLSETPLRGRKLALWAWVLGVGFAPEGLFIALAAAKLLSWPRAILLAILSYFSLASFVLLLMMLDAVATPSPVASATVCIVMMGVFAVWIYLVYRIGERARYWSRFARTVWRIVFWIFVAILFAYLIDLGIQFVARRA